LLGLRKSHRVRRQVEIRLRLVARAVLKTPSGSQSLSFRLHPGRHLPGFLLSFLAGGTKPKNLELRIDDFEIMASTNLLTGFLEEMIFEFYGHIAADANDVLVRKRVLFQLVVLVPFGKIEFSQKSQRRQQFESAISSRQANVRAFLQKQHVQFFGRKMMSVRLLSKNLQNSLALRRDAMTTLAQAFKNRIGRT